ncbi:hemolymph lipopolysaccharide-binding protein-like [Phymastichus coffea]|uniref:hemolymph lipopolysaccharide-binding protein-like n=1 Tax=Phymastichus coffea TaxID=108790 RepID=UPI00273AB30E|nr:hemolymph lipopolysaccharide-binding protein-like [Phymastichus coffea]
MKVIFGVMVLCTVKSYIIQASPMIHKNVELGESLPTNEDQEITAFNGYIPTAGIGIHKYHNAQRQSWNDARKTCLNEGGHLAVINSVAEESLIIKYMNITGNISVDQFWIGIHELFKKDEWISVKDERLDAIGYTHWMAGQPDGTPNEHCLTITPHGMNDFVCDHPLYFVCEL